MAAPREHQGYQIALVIFVMTTVLLSITTFMFFRKYKEEQDRNLQAAADLAKSNQDSQQLEKDLASIKPLLGYTNEAIDVIAKDVETDLRIYAPYRTNDAAAAPAAPPPEDVGFEGEAPVATEISNPLNYRELAKQMKLVLDKRNADAVKLTEDKQEQEKAIAANRTEDKGKIDAALASQKKAQDELAAERTKFNTDREGQVAKMGELTKALDAKDARTSALDTDLTVKIAELRNQLSKETRTRQLTVQRLMETQPKNFETTDGEITAVIARDRTVYINLGSADGLRPQVTFSVYAAENPKLVATESKAKIEVTQISGPKAAIARITEDSRGNPIMPGDKIFSQAFHPGRRIHFAIAPISDIDGDGDSDAQRLRDLIHVNGGIIDAEVTDDGKLIDDNGKGIAIGPDLFRSTRYIILGEAPSDPKVLDKRSELITEAKRFGVQEMNVQQFLDMMGYKTDERTVGLGKGADPADFKPKSNSAYDKPFRERRPPAATNGAK